MTNTQATQALAEATENLLPNISEAMKTGGWVPTPLKASFWSAVAEAGTALAAQQQAEPSAELIEKARKWDHIQPHLCKTCGGFGLVDRSTRDGPDAEPCPDCNELSSPAPAPLTDEAIAARNPYAHSANHRSVWAAGFRDAERAHKIGIVSGGGA